jgi:para-nitrobenzyl esterase
VPFAEAPVGALRFRPPVAAKAWTGERDATKFAAAAMQPGAAGVPQSEDCLYLNVWAPSGKGPFPVFVWVHGGGFTGGRSFDPVQDGEKFADAGIVCVTVAYRLGVFGFLDVEPLLGPGYAGSANNAVRDLIAALTWVKENIGSFGGDPAKVTVGGESAGAKLTDILMGVPAAKGLFQQMISESGGAERVWSKADSAKVVKGFGEAWGKSDLLTAPAGALIETQTSFVATWPQHFPLRAEVDGVLIPRLPVETIALGSTRGKRLLIGTNRDESASFIGPHPQRDPVAGDLGNLPLSKFDGVYQKYAALYPEMTAERLRIRGVTAEEYWIPSMRVLDAHVRGGGAAWDYRLDLTESTGRMQGYAYHSLDTGMVWGRPHGEVGNASTEAALARQMHAAWVAFIRGGVPAAEGLPSWPAYRSDTRPTMIFDAQSRVETRPQETEMRFWDGVL